jgi:penicillin amidase
MHLGLSAPGIWYRAQLVVRPQGAAGQALSVAGVTLPGAPTMVAGSNGHIAWGSPIPISTRRMPWQSSRRREREAITSRRRAEADPARGERLCIRGDCEDLIVEETVWGPIVGKDAFGRQMRCAGPRMKRARCGCSQCWSWSARVSSGRRWRSPIAPPFRSKNLVVGDSAGNIGWTIIGRAPARFGFDGRDVVSFADGAKGWLGMLAPDQIPVLVKPAAGRLWTANARVIGGDAYAKLGDGRYDTGAPRGPNSRSAVREGPVRASGFSCDPA